jgi:WD40 repeat protein
LAFERFGIGFNPIEFSSAGEVLEGMNPLAFCVAPIPIGFTAGWSNAAKTEQFEVQPLRIDGISRSGKFMATRIGQRIGKATHPEQTITRIWNIETGDEWMAPSEKVRRGQACAFSPINDSVIILTPTAKSRGEASMSDLILWNLESQESRQICSGLIPTDPSPEIVFSIDGRLIFCTCLQGTVNGPAIVDVTNGEYVASLSRGSGIVTAFASVMFTPDGKRLLTHSYSGAVELWDVVTGVRVFELGNVPTASYRISVASDGNAIIAYSRDREKGSVIWRAATSEELQPAMKAP